VHEASGEDDGRDMSHYNANLLRELRGLWRLRRKVYCYECGYEPYIYELCVSTDVGSRQTVMAESTSIYLTLEFLDVCSDRIVGHGEGVLRCILE
jgi:hypothetical protein